jgi:copper chaperone CopZ
MTTLNKSLVLLTFLAGFAAQADSQTFTTDKMTCGSCVEKVQTKVCQPMIAAKKLNTCEVSVNQVIVSADKVNVEEVKKAISKLYPVTAVAATAPKMTPAPATN